ncbi:glycosyltransferase [Catenuloplanes indicus]|uniref:Glycosyltransferase involved in cell wall biosynthesis n=1 Tax=Catenuloplanes indicus TaxID=137267 RepID=A0AAE3VUL1_9ACTN|nr:glycosyltransferase [Catenuloplanes indicus]MDQ0363954.1 glycosyltransferase involved in cell wall biosynthesis [Catenuloplanes indicus]
MSAADAPLRVLHVSHTAHAGGAELALARLLSQEPPWSATVCAPAAGDAFAQLERRGVEVRRCLPDLPTGGTRGRDPVLAVRYLAALRAGARALRSSSLLGETDVVHANTAAAAIMCALALRGTSVPLVVHLRDLVTADSLGRFALAAFSGTGLRRAAGAIANSRSTLESAAGRLSPAVPGVVIPSPIGLTRPATAPTVRRTVRTVGMLGRLQPWKGQHVFLEAFARAFAGTDVRAHLAGAALFGAAGYAEQLRRRAGELGISGQVTFLGHVDDVASFLDSVDVVVHASTRPEPLGQTVLQGLAYGRPVIASAGGGPGEWITSGVNGLLVEPGDPAALAAALTGLAESYEVRARLAAAAFRTTGILTDRECAAAHGEFFRAVARRSAVPGGRAAA